MTLALLHKDGQLLDTRVCHQLMPAVRQWSWQYYDSAMLNRKIIFYRWQDVDGQKPFTPHVCTKALQEAIMSDSKQSILVKGDTITAVQVLDQGDSISPSRLQLLSLRHEDSGPIEWGPGRPIRRLVVSNGGYAADLTHVCIWPDGIAAQEWHGHVPRLARLSHFLRVRLDVYTSFEQLYNAGMLDQLNRLRGRFRSVEIALTGPHPTRNDERSVFGTLIPAVYGDRVPSVSIQFGMGRYGRRDRYIDQGTEEIVFALAEQAQDQLSRMVVHGRDPDTGRVVPIDLLNERLGVDVVVSPDNEVPSLADEAAIFREIVRSRELLAAAGDLDSAVQAQSMRSS